MQLLTFPRVAEGSCCHPAERSQTALHSDRAPFDHKLLPTEVLVHLCPCLMHVVLDKHPWQHRATCSRKAEPKQMHWVQPPGFACLGPTAYRPVCCAEKSIGSPDAACIVALHCQSDGSFQRRLQHCCSAVVNSASRRAYLDSPGAVCTAAANQEGGVERWILGCSCLALNSRRRLV